MSACLEILAIIAIGKQIPDSGRGKIRGLLEQPRPER
jgi:hypothetical protein